MAKCCFADLDPAHVDGHGGGVARGVAGLHRPGELSAGKQLGERGRRGQQPVVEPLAVASLGHQGLRIDERHRAEAAPGQPSAPEPPIGQRVDARLRAVGRRSAPPDCVQRQRASMSYRRLPLGTSRCNPSPLSIRWACALCGAESSNSSVIIPTADDEAQQPLPVAEEIFVARAEGMTNIN